MKTLLSQALASGLLMAGLGVAHAQPDPSTPQVQVELRSSSQVVRPGDNITLGVHQHIAPGWHTYWRNPGDSGLPTTIEWKLPRGVNAGAIQWPAPTRFVQGSLGNYGYEQDVTLLVPLHIAPGVRVEQDLPIQAHVKWLVCKDTCLPQEATLNLTLHTSSASAPHASPPAWLTDSHSPLSVPAPWPVHVQAASQALLLSLPDDIHPPRQDEEVYFFPNDPGVVDAHAPQRVTQQGDTTVLKMVAGDSPAQVGQSLGGTLVTRLRQGDHFRTHAYAIQAVLQSVPAALPPAPSSLNEATSTVTPGLPAALLLALLGGMVLNLMPCVFPVLSIKALSMLNHGTQTNRERRLHGLAYTLGVLVSFGALALALLALKAGGQQAGWGFQFQSPTFVLFVAYLMFGVGLNLSGLFTLGHGVTGVGSSLADKEGYAGSFFTGVLATVVATPCTAPFMGGAVGFALTQPALPMLMVFLSLGLGLALPYLVLSWWPALQRWLPRPGLWMERLKQLLAFPMYGAAIWLVWVLTQQAGANSVVIALAGMVALAFAGWLYATTRHSRPVLQHGGSAVALLVLLSVASGGYAALRVQPSATGHGSSAMSATTETPRWQAYSADRLHQLRAQGKPVFVDLSAAWCITCLVNERVALDQPLVAQVFASHGIEALRGDWTNQDPDISRLLAEFGRSGVPLYVYYPAGEASHPEVLPQILTTDTVLSIVTRPTL
ncbi:MAG TPA: protein-disulfide reductase DsbD domain-containing protein [Aquabacterium sp.]|nr:protein-disulfide reductase DsbD domain-containing protein [Aquabacterium sp.]